MDWTITPIIASLRRYLKQPITDFKKIEWLHRFSLRLGVTPNSHSRILNILNNYKKHRSPSSLSLRRSHAPSPHTRSHLCVPLGGSPCSQFVRTVHSPRVGLTTPSCRSFLASGFPLLSLTRGWVLTSMYTNRPCWCYSKTRALPS